MNKAGTIMMKAAAGTMLLSAAAGGAAFLGERLEERKKRRRPYGHEPHGIYERFVKRPLDCALSTGALLVLSPVFLVTAAAVKVSSPGSVFYYSDRAGRNKKPFHFYKFRSMHNVDETHQQKDLYTADQDRLFPVGRLIRKLKIDELPQLLNVIKGDMSIVGPRPMPMSSVDRQYCGKYAAILRVKPGLTSAASLYDYTVGEQYADDEEQYRKVVVPVKLEMELLYESKQSFAYDAGLIFRTVKTICSVAAGRTAFPEQPEFKEIMGNGGEE